MNIKSALWEAVPLPRADAYVVAKIGTAAIQFYSGEGIIRPIAFAGRTELASIYTAAAAERAAATLNAKAFK